MLLKRKHEPFGKFIDRESEIDANNNRFGAALRKQYETQEEFEKAAIDAVISLREGKTVEVDGLTPLLSQEKEALLPAALSISLTGLPLTGPAQEK